MAVRSEERAHGSQVIGEGGDHDGNKVTETFSEKTGANFLPDASGRFERRDCVLPTPRVHPLCPRCSELLVVKRT